MSGRRPPTPTLPHEGGGGELGASVARDRAVEAPRAYASESQARGGARPAPEGHKLKIRVYWEDTDAGGIVYHSNYLNFAERGRTEMVRAIGLRQSELASEGAGFFFAVRHVDMDFLKPARLDDLLEVESRVTEVGGASMEVGQVIRRLDDGADLVRLHVGLAFISRDGRPARIPAGLRDTLRNLVSERR